MFDLRHVIAKVEGYTLIAQSSRSKRPLNDMSPSGDNDTKWRTYRSLWPIILIQALLLSSAFSLGYFRPQEMRTVQTQMDELVSIGSVERIFEYDRMYSSSPSNETNRAWIDLFPSNSGFIEHPVLAPNLSVVAVFHQLHCIVCRFDVEVFIRESANACQDAIRYGYYTALGEVGEENIARAGFADHGSPRHVRHCFDYLRQSVMCHADTNLEPVIPRLGGARGFGSKHTCRNFNELVDWMTKWDKD